MDDKGKTLDSLGLDDIAPAAGQQGPGLGSGDFSPKANGGPAMDPTDEEQAKAPEPPAALKKGKTPPLGLVALLMAAGALVISLWALWTTPAAMVVADGSNLQPIQAQLDNLSNRISEFEVSPLGPPDKKSHTASISLLRRKVVSLSAKIDALEQDQRRLQQAQANGKKAARTSKPVVTAAAKTTATVVATATAKPTKVAQSTTKKITHTVRSGQTLSLLSRRYNVTITAIRRWNGLRGNNIKVGQKLTIYVKQ